MILYFLLINFFIGISIDETAGLDPVEPVEEVCLSPEEKKLHTIINAYRKSKKLKPVPLSASLTKVAQVHARDLMDNYTKSDKCNPHSWSKKGGWTACCYTNDHKQAQCMWDKPQEIAEYYSPGYEIVYWHSAAAQADGALAGWQKSKGHNPIIINEGMWEKVNWGAIGVAVYEQYAVVWFGEMQDEKGAAKMCD